MEAFEVFFDTLYLAFVVFLGIRNLLLKGRDSKLIGSMTLVLGLGDSFHLIPRIFANVMADGFIKTANYLFVGTRVSAITMSVFYLLFYLYVRSDNNKNLDRFMTSIFILRLILIVTSLKKSYMSNLIANIPFVIMGIIVIYALYKQRKKDIYKNLYIYVFFSFFFYVPVVLFKDVYPMVGILMIPKTIMYVLIVIKLNSNIIKSFSRKDIVYLAIAYLLMGILLGAFYREIGKIYTISQKLGLVHTHTIILGFVLLAIFYLLIKNLNISDLTIKKSLNLYNVGLLFTISGLFLHGLLDPYKPANFIKFGLISLSGTGHIFLTIALLYIVINSLKAVENL